MPELAAEWHPRLNLPLTPFDVRPRGKASVWWQCRIGHVWKAKVAPRAVGIGCPHCSTIGVSEREVRLAHELDAAGLPVQHDHPRIPVEGRRPVKADIVMPALHLIVEYDGRTTTLPRHARIAIRRGRSKPLGGQPSACARNPLPRLVATKCLYRQRSQ